MQKKSPFEILSPYERWVPTPEQMDLVHDAYDKLLPPMVQMESIAFLYEVCRARDKYEMMKFDSSGRVSTGMFFENWPRYVIKMATGSGKTKIIAPNIIVLNRLRRDFDNFKVFKEEPFIPENGFDDRDWKNDFFRITLHIQDELKPVSESGNLFLTNIHDSDLEWYKSIEEINNKLKLKYGTGLSLHADFTATPKHEDGSIFVQTVCDYPLVEAIRHNVVKSPVLPDEAELSDVQEP